jgi:membrane associated rhomboid family serine protease
MFIPLHDANQLRFIRHSYVNLGIIAVNIAAFLITAVTASESFSNASVIGLGYIPSVIHDIVELPPELVLVPENLTYLTYAFLHADIFHLGGNLIFLWVFGDNVEDAMGHVKYLIFYLLCAIAGAFLHGIILASSEEPLIGASGAIAGVVVAYLMLHPHVKLWVLALMRIPLRIPAWIPIALWVIFQFVMLFTQTDDQISWPAHVGGIIAGIILVPLLKRRNVRLFDRPPAAATAPNSVIQPIVIPAKPEPSVKWGRQGR